MYVCICNTIREADFERAARHVPGDAEQVYAALGHLPQCCQCLEDADEMLADIRCCNKLCDAA